MHYNVQYDPARLERINGSLVHPEYLAFNGGNYLDPRQIEIKKQFPFLALTTKIEESTFTLDLLEPYAAFTVAMPALFALTLLGVASLFFASNGAYRVYLIILVPALLAGLTLLTFAAISYRYEHDWFPYFFFGSFLGSAMVSRMPSGQAKISVLSGLSVAGIWSILATIGFIADLRQSPLFGWFPGTFSVNAASFRAGPAAPGEMITLFGVNLGPATLQTARVDSTGRIATNLGGLQVFFDGVASPVIYASATQSTVIVPYSVSGKNSVNLQIQFNQAGSAVIPLRIVDSSPGVFTANSSGAGPLAALNQDGSQNSRNNPASPGDVIVFFGSGEGLTDISMDGSIAGQTPPKPKLPVSVTIGGEVSEVVYAGGLTGQTAGLLQLNVRVPVDALSGLLPVVLTVGTQSSQERVTIAIR
jgi:uncharacterized protein (TIGR03437 family)